MSSNGASLHIWENSAASTVRVRRLLRSASCKTFQEAVYLYHEAVQYVLSIFATDDGIIGSGIGPADLLEPGSMSTSEFSTLLGEMSEKCSEVCIEWILIGSFMESSLASIHPSTAEFWPTAKSHFDRAVKTGVFIRVSGKRH